MGIDWKHKIDVYFEAIFDIFLEGLLVTIWIVITYGWTQFIKVVFGDLWPQGGDHITIAALLIVVIIGSVEFVISVSARTYDRLRKDTKRDDQNQTD